MAEAGLGSGRQLQGLGLGQAGRSPGLESRGRHWSPSHLMLLGDRESTEHIMQDPQALSKSLPSARFHPCSTREPCTAIAACMTPTVFLVLVTWLGPGCMRGDTRALTGAGVGARPPCCSGSTWEGSSFQPDLQRLEEFSGFLHVPLPCATPNHPTSWQQDPQQPSPQSSQPLSLLKGIVIFFFH